MYEVKKISVCYVNSEYVEHQGNRKSIENYLRAGYSVQQARNGWWLLTKPSQAIVSCEYAEGGYGRFSARTQLLDWYGHSRLTQNLVSRFISDFSDGKVRVYVDENGLHISKP